MRDSIIKELKTPADTQSEDQLKMPLMTLIFGEGKVQIGKHLTARNTIAPQSLTGRE
jgi:hypothetical protein